MPVLLLSQLFAFIVKSLMNKVIPPQTWPTFYFMDGLNQAGEG
jgi:hypothetical protein